MGYSAGFGKPCRPNHLHKSNQFVNRDINIGAVNFSFGLLAMRRIDTWGRRKLMLTTLPLMSLFLAVAAMTFIHDYWKTHIPALVVFIYCRYLLFVGRKQEFNSILVFSAVYSPSLGPIPFTLASESFPLAQREAVSSSCFVSFRKPCARALSCDCYFSGTRARSNLILMMLWASFRVVLLLSRSIYSLLGS